MQLPPKITREAVNQLPLQSFEGEISILTSAQQTKAVWREMASHRVVGFDTETRPSFRKGERHHVALMQLAIPGKVFLIRLHETGIDDEMIAFLENKHIIKTGVGLQNDIKALQKLRLFTPNQFVELASIGRKIGLQEEGVKKLAAIVLGFRISKSAQISNWSAPCYTQKQVRYAATDAWVCLCLYEKLTAALKAREQHNYPVVVDGKEGTKKPTSNLS